MKLMIQNLMAGDHRVTCYDSGKTTAHFILAVVIDEPIDIWYVAEIVGARNYRANVVGNLLVFPELSIDKEMFEFICAENHDPI